MAATFPCPYCGATYPIKPVLVDRPVRCTTCRQVFKLGPDGTAAMVDPPPTPPAPAAPVAAAPEPQSRAEVSPPAATPPAAPAKRPPGPPVPAPPPTGEVDLLAVEHRPPTTASHKRRESSSEDAGKRKHSSRLTAKQEAVRRTMAANLTGAAERALASEKVRRETERAKRDEKKKQIKEGGVGDLGPAVLTGEGEREARGSRRWAIGCLTLLVLLIVAWSLSRSTTPAQQALATFVLPDPDHENWRNNREDHIRQRAWLHSQALPYILNMDEAELDDAFAVDLSLRSDEIAKLFGGKVLLEEHDLWVPLEQAAQTRTILAGLPPDTEEAVWRRALDRTAIRYETHERQMDLLAQRSGLPPHELGVLRLLLEGQTSADGSNWIRDLFCLGDEHLKRGGAPAAQIPRRIWIAPFRGSDGKRLFRKNPQQYGIHPDQIYRGRLMRFEDPAWASAADGKVMSHWYVLDVQVANRAGRFPPTPGWPEEPADVTEAAVEAEVVVDTPDTTGNGD